MQTLKTYAQHLAERPPMGCVSLKVLTKQLIAAAIQHSADEAARKQSTTRAALTSTKCNSIKTYKANRAKVLKHITGHGPLSVAEMARGIKISEPTCWRHVDEMLSERLIKNVGTKTQRRWVLA